MKSNIKTHFALTIVAAFMVMFTSNPAIGQDPEFSQFYSNPVYLNPALAGTEPSGRVGINFRNQWAAINQPFRTFSASYDAYAKNLSGGLGIQFVNDGAGSGTYQSNSISGIYAYHATLNRKYRLNVGAKAGYSETSINWDEMTFADMLDPDQGFVNASNEQQPMKSRGYLDLSAGAVVYSSKMFAGISVSHLHEPITGLVGENKLPRRFTFHGGTNIKMGDKFNGTYTLAPNILYSRQGEFEQLNLGMYLHSGVITAGVWYRSTDAIILLFGVKTSKFSVGYSYDMTTSRLTMASGGSHEISFIIKIRQRTGRMNYQQIPCAEF
jgi:type IX secretion system PorP/SprF family membrane protein